MLLKYNISSNSFKRRKIDILSYDITNTENEYKKLKISCKTNTPHNLNVGDKVIFKINEFDELNSIEKSLEILSDDFSKNTFSFLYDKFKSIKIKTVYKNDDFDLVVLDKKIPFLVNANDSFNVYKLTYNYEFLREATDSDKNIHEVKSIPNKTYNGQYVKYFNNIWEWKEKRKKIICVCNTNYSFTYYYNSDDDFDEITKNDNLEIDNLYVLDDNGLIREDVSLLEYNSNLLITLPIISENKTELLDENIAQTYFDEKKKELINGIVDYEKVCFSPAYDQSIISIDDLNTSSPISGLVTKLSDEPVYLYESIGYASDVFNGLGIDVGDLNDPIVTLYNKMEYVNSIRFNLFFRDRDKETWNSNDNLGWFQCKVNSDGDFNIPEKLLNGDLLGNLNFTNDDVYYRKQKLGKSFLRLSFYDNNNPMKQMLLFYSTIFVDTAELYDKYCRIMSNRKNKNFNAVNSIINGDDNLTLSFVLNDKYIKNKSSEGFYLYLFPDGVDTENGKTIYMKVEFNHAGNGKTIPFIYPNDGKKALDFSNSNFPFALLNEDDSNLNEYYRQLYIPITIKYDKNLNDYIYYFNILNENKSDIVINLFEPKLNPTWK